MQDYVWLPTKADKLWFENIEEGDYGKPTIAVYKDSYFLQSKRVELEEWQVSSLINNMTKFMAALEKYKIKEAKELKQDKEQLLKLAKKTLAKIADNTQ